MYAKSNGITIFPVTKRSGAYQTSSRLITENSQSRLLRLIADNDASYVISYSEDDGIEFCIYGYYVKISSTELASIKSSLSTNVYASITLSTINDLEEIVGLDSGETYSGVNFTSSEQSGTGIHSLKLLSNINSTWEVPEGSYVKINSLSTDLYIDGGIIS